MKHLSPRGLMKYLVNLVNVPLILKWNYQFLSTIPLMSLCINLNLLATPKIRQWLQKTF